MHGFPVPPRLRALAAGALLASALARPSPAAAQTFSSGASAPATVAPGASATITATVTNTSSVALSNGIVDVEVYDAAGTRVSQAVCSPVSLGGGATTTCSVGWTAPSATGTYAVKLGVFGAGWAPLYHWNNGAGSIGVAVASQPTFSSSASASPATVAPGATVTISATVTNTSSAALSNGIVDLEIYDAGGTKIWQQVCSPVSLAAGASTTCAYPWTAASTAGTYAIKIGVFGSGWAPLLHWNGSAGSVTVAVASGPTFSSRASASPATVAPGATSTISATVTNTSSAALSGGLVDLEIYDAGGTKIWQQACSPVSIAAGASATCAYPWTAPSASGTYAVKIGVFGAGWAPLYHWNGSAASVTVAVASAPAFASSASASPALVAPGATSTISATVTNTSSAALSSGVVDLEIYDAGGTKIWQQACSPVSVAAGASTTCAYPWTAPATSGTYAVKIGVFGAGWTPLYHWNGAAASVSVGSGGGSGGGGSGDLAARLGKPARLLVGFGGDKASVDQAQLTVDILDHYVTVLPNEVSWIYWGDPSGSGAYAAQHAAEADALGAVPMFTLYGLGAWREHDNGSLWRLGDGAFMSSYWASVRVLFQRLGAYGRPALVNLEPDFWGYAELASSNPAATYANVSAAGAECGGLSQDVAGVGQCFLALARALAPNALVGMMPSRWGSPSTQAIADFMRAVHAGDADFVPIETSDRDAGCYETGCDKAGQGYWSAADYDAHFAMAQLFHQTLAKPLVWWQTPLGVASDTSGWDQHYRDNHAQTFFADPGRLVAVGGAAMVFSAGNGAQTQLWTDGGQLKRLSDAFYASQGSPPPPPPPPSGTFPTCRWGGTAQTFDKVCQYAGDASPQPSFAGMVWGFDPAAVVRKGWNWFEVGYPIPGRSGAYQALAAGGTRPFAYVNMAEVPNNDGQLQSQIDGVLGYSWTQLQSIGQNGSWSSTIIDVRQADWQKWLLARAEYAYGLGLRGVKWDVANMEDLYRGYWDPNAAQQAIEAMGAMMTELHARHPDMKQIVNQGYALAARYPAVVDGLEVEAMIAIGLWGSSGYQQWFHEEQAKWTAVHDQYGIPVLMAEYEDPNGATAAQMVQMIGGWGLTPYITDSEWRYEGRGLYILPPW